LQPTTQVLSRTDLDRLRRLIHLNEARLAREAEAFAALEESLEKARIVEADEVPGNVVTLYSQVRLRETDSSRVFLITVALPGDGESKGCTSFWHTYATAALLGAREGDDLVWRSAEGLRRARIEQVLSSPKGSSSSMRPLGFDRVAPIRAPSGDRALVSPSIAGVPDISRVVWSPPSPSP